MAKILIFKKHFTRDYPLFCCDVWSRGNIEGLSECVKNILFKFEPKKPTTIWYVSKEMDNYSADIVKKTQDFKFTQKKTDTYIELTQKLVRHIENDQIKNLEDLKKFYDLWVKQWPLLAFVYRLPETAAMEKSKDLALKTRRKTEKYSDIIENTFSDFFMKKFPDFKKYVYVISPAEVFSLGKKNFKKQIISLLEKRLNNVFYYYNGRIYFEDEFARLNIIADDEKIDGKVKEIKGDIAYKGKAKGKVRIIFKKQDIGNIQENEILVTTMTTPDFLPAIKKSLAIITDEGGITSHAAIISRELKKPCIIATKIATKILKTGDMIEVDAIKGIVKRIYD